MPWLLFFFLFFQNLVSSRTGIGTQISSTKRTWTGILSIVCLLARRKAGLTELSNLGKPTSQVGLPFSFPEAFWNSETCLPDECKGQERRRSLAFSGHICSKRWRFSHLQIIKQTNTRLLGPAWQYITPRLPLEAAAKTRTTDIPHRPGAPPPQQLCTSQREKQEWVENCQHSSLT